jgi:ComF family protein
MPVSQIKLLARQVSTAALDLVFPPHCVNCERVGSFLCPRCLATVTQAPARSLPQFDGIRVRANYEGAVSSAIHAFKYERQIRLVEPLGRLLSEMLQDVDWPVDLVTAVPLHTQRLRERGYNQAALLAAYLAQTRGWEFTPAALVRIRETASQVQLNAQERLVNVADAFRADAGVVSGKNVLVLDDVLTTGATLSACADALWSAGARAVFGAALAGAVYASPAQTETPAALVGEDSF